MTKNGLAFDDILLIPNYSEVPSRKLVDLRSRFTKNYSIRLPFISANMDTVTGAEIALKLNDFGASGIIHRFCSPETEAKMISKLKQKDCKIRAASIGISSETTEKNNDGNLKRLQMLVEAGANIICIDIAHGHHKHMANTIQLCKKFDIDIIAGNIATGEAAEFLCNKGVDAVKVGIGPGSMCTTRINTGFGVPQVTAIEDVKAVTANYDVPVIADGGIRNSGDVAKALAAGADTVMIGSLFAGCKETPGIIHREGNFPDYHLYKQYRGSASLSSKQDQGAEKRNVEGISARVDYKGPVKYVIKNLEDGLRSAFSYAGAFNIAEYHSKIKYIRKFSAS